MISEYNTMNKNQEAITGMILTGSTTTEMKVEQQYQLTLN